MTAPLRIDEPRCGFYKMRLVRGGPFVPVQLELVDGERDPDTHELLGDQTYTLTVNGQATTDWNEILRKWPWFAGHQISEQEHSFMAAERVWLDQHGQGEPGADPMQPIDLGICKTIF